MRALSLLALLAAPIGGCTLALSRADHERPARDPDEATCTAGCRASSVCALDTDRCADCFGATGRVEIPLAPGEVAGPASTALRGADGRIELWIAFLAGPAAGPRRPSLFVGELTYSPARAAFEMESPPAPVAFQGDFATLASPRELAIALDARGRIAVFAAGDAGLAVGAVRHDVSGEAWSSRTLTFGGLRLEGPILTSPAAGPALPDVPEAWAASLARDPDGALYVVGAPPTSEGQVERRALDAPHALFGLVGGVAYLGPPAGGTVVAVELAEGGATRTLATDGRTGPLAAIDADASCALLAWPRQGRAELAIDPGCGRTASAVFWPSDGAAPRAIALAPSRVGTLALLATTERAAQAFVLDGDGHARALAGHGTHGIPFETGTPASLAAGRAPAAGSDPAPWPIAVASSEGGRVVVALGRGCDAALE